MMYNKIMEREKGSRKETEPKGNDLMKKLTSKIIRILYIVSTIVIVPIAVVEIFEIVSGRAAVDPHIRNLTDGLFWSVFTLFYLCQWYIRKHNKETATY